MDEELHTTFSFLSREEWTNDPVIKELNRNKKLLHLVKGEVSNIVGLITGNPAETLFSNNRALLSNVQLSAG